MHKVVALALVIVVLSILNAALVVLLYLERREAREDYRQIVNEWSVRTGGRLVHREEKPEVKTEPTIDRGQFRIMTPSMALAEAEESEPNGDGQMSEEDMAWLRKTGVIQ